MTSLIRINRLGHLVLTVADINRTCKFYHHVLGFEVIANNGKTALRFGRQKINLHQQGKEISPKAALPTPGSGDLCFITETPMEEVLAILSDHKVNILLGPVERQGALGKMISVYFRDPDENLLEVSKYDRQIKQYHG